MRSSCIRQPEKESLIILRAWQVEACDGDRCAALLLSFFEYWHNIKLEQLKKATEANNVAETHGDDRTQDETLYQFHTEKQLEEGLLGLYKRTKIGEAVKLLAAKGFISITQNPNPRYKFDKTRFFQFKDHVVNQWLMEYRSTKYNGSSTENGSQSTDNGSQSTESDATIPKTTTKTSELDQKRIAQIFDHWNNQKIRVHKKLTDSMAKKIKKALKDHPLEEIKTAISTYREILKGSQYYWTYVWTLEEFLDRGIDKFSEPAIARQNYHKDRDRRQEEEVIHPAHVFRGTRRIADDENFTP